MRQLVLCGLVLLPATALLSQTNFEVASIRPAAVTTAGSSFNTFEGGRIRIANEPVKLLIRVAFQMQNDQIVGGPEWIGTDPYDIDAKTGRPEKITPREMSTLMLNLLEERFHLKWHREPREITAYALTVAKGGPNLTPNTEGEPGMNSSTGKDKSEAVATATSMDLLAAYIGNRLGRTVVNKTGLAGNYDFKLTWSPDERQDSPAPPLVTAMREQLGLRLESQKTAVEFLVIDSIERPSAN